MKLKLIWVETAMGDDVGIFGFQARGVGVELGLP